MDTQAFLVNREVLQGRMAMTRAAISEHQRHRKSWWLGWPLMSFGALWAAGKVSARQHPYIRQFLITGAKRLATQVAKQWGLHKMTEPSILQRLLSFVH